MAIKEVLRMGHPLLRVRANEIIEFNTPFLDGLIEDMFDTMAERDGVGLAAPQIGVSLRLVIFGVEASPRYPDAEPVPATVLINPEITLLDDEQVEGWEGCLSIPGMRGPVSRYERIAYRGVDQFGNVIDKQVSGFHARVVQHECDHLDGILYPQRMLDMSRFGFVEELDAAQARD